MSEQEKEVALEQPAEEEATASSLTKDPPSSHVKNTCENDLVGQDDSFGSIGKSQFESKSAVENAAVEISHETDLRLQENEDQFDSVTEPEISSKMPEVTNTSVDSSVGVAEKGQFTPQRRVSPDPFHLPHQFGPVQGTNYSLPFPPFFANPFMAPYLPQQYGTALQSSEEQSQGGEMPPVGDARFRCNPYSGGYFLTPSQYQDMMQQYFQSVLAAGGIGQNPMLPSGVSPVSDPGDVVYDDTKECAESLKRMKLGEGGRSAPWYPSYPLPPPVWSSDSNQQFLHYSSALPQPEETPDETGATIMEENSGQSPDRAEGSTNDGIPATSPSSVQSQSFSFPSPATTISENKIDSVPDSIESSPEKGVPQPQHLVVSGSRAEALANQSESEAELVRHQQKPAEKENPTSMLIKKQMSEIEKEINRKSANSNVKKVDPRDLETFLREERNFMAWNGQVHTEMTNQVSGWVESGMPGFGGAPNERRSGFQPLRDTRSLREIPVQEEAAPVRPSHLFQPHFPQATLAAQSTSVPRTAAYVPHAMPPRGMYPSTSFGRTGFQPYHPHLQQMPMRDPSVPRMPAGLSQHVPQEQIQLPVRRIPVAPSPEHTQTVAENGNGNLQAPDLEVAHPGMEHETNYAEESGTQEQNGWGGDGKEPAGSKEGGEEPVWVMRESYLRRLKREEERQQQRERREEQLALAHADRAAADSDTDNETDRLLERQRALQQQQQQDLENSNQSTHRPRKKKEVMIHEPAVLIEGVLFRARYLGSTQLICEGRPSKTTRMMQAQEAVSRIKAPEDEAQPSTEVDLFISTEKIMVLNTDLQDIMMDHPLRTISYIADIGDVVVLMARRVSQSSSSPDSPDQPTIRRTPKIICHVFESEEAQFIAQSIGQAFQVAYMEFLRANGIDDPRTLQSFDYEEVLNSQEILGEELEMFANKESQKDVVIPKQKGEILGVVVVESGWGSMLPTVVVANLMPAGPASRCNQLNIGDQIIAINGISLVGLPLSSAQTNIKNTKHQNAVKLTVVHTPPVVEVRIKRPDSKYQLGFSVQNGVICSLLRGGIAERGGVRVGHRIIEINNQSVVAVAHEKIVNMLATAVGEIQMKTMPTSMFRLLTGQETPNYI